MQTCSPCDTGELRSPPGGDQDDEGKYQPPNVSVRRPDDLLVFDLIFKGFVFKENPPRLERASKIAYIIVKFPPQSFGEEAYLKAEKFDEKKKKLSR